MVKVSHLYMTTGRTIALTIWTFVGKVVSLIFNMLSRLVIAFVPRSRHLLISWLQAPSAMILDPKKTKSVAVLFSKCLLFIYFRGFPGGSDSEESTCNAGDPGSIPGLGRSPGEGNGNPLQCSCLKNSMDRGAWWATVHGVKKSQTQLSD